VPNQAVSRSLPAPAVQWIHSHIRLPRSSLDGQVDECSSSGAKKFLPAAAIRQGRVRKSQDRRPLTDRVPRLAGEIKIAPGLASTGPSRPTNLHRTRRQLWFGWEPGVWPGQPAPGPETCTTEFLAIPSRTPGGWPGQPAATPEGLLKRDPGHYQ